MKQWWVFLITLFLILSCNVTKTTKNSRSEKEKQNREKLIELKNRVTERDFSFTATRALPVNGGNFHLNTIYDITIMGDTVISYLPYYGVAYQVEYGARNSPLEFKTVIEDLEIKEIKKALIVTLSAKYRMDNFKFTFHIHDPENISLNINSINRQPITFLGYEKLLEKQDQ